MIRPTISPNNPRALAKISITNILTNNEALAASANAAPEPTDPTAVPHIKLQNPTVAPPQNTA